MFVSKQKGPNFAYTKSKTIKLDNEQPLNFTCFKIILVKLGSILENFPATLALFRRRYNLCSFV